MPDTTNRPTLKELAAYWGGTSLLDVLRQEGYVIVHPDDVAPADRNHPGWDYNGTWGEGWNACRAHIFRADA